VNKEQFLAELGARSAEQKITAERIASVKRAMRVKFRALENFYEILIPGVAWGGSLIALAWLWRMLDAHALAGIIIGHVILRLLGRIVVNVWWIPAVGRELADRFPEFAADIETVWAEETKGEAS